MALKNNKSFHREYQPGLLNYGPNDQDEDNIYNPAIGSFYESIGGVNASTPQTYGATILGLPVNKGLGGNNPTTSGYSNGEPRARANHGLVVNGSICLQNFQSIPAGFQVMPVPQSFQFKTLIGWGSWEEGSSTSVKTNTDFKILSGYSGQAILNGPAFEIATLNPAFEVGSLPALSNLSHVKVFDNGEGIFRIVVNLGIQMWGDLSSRTFRVSGTYYLF